MNKKCSVCLHSHKHKNTIIFICFMLLASFAISTCDDSSKPSVAIPTGVMAITQDRNQINISWDAVSGATGYTLYDYALVVTTISGVSFSHTGLQPSSLHYYTVKAHKEKLSSGQSSGVYASTYPYLHIAGYEKTGSKNRAATWKNGLVTYLSDGSQHSGANDVVVVGGDVYAVGYKFNGTKDVAIYWKNGTENALTDGRNNAYANAIAVVGTDVYIAGNENNGTTIVAKVWLNGTAINLSTGTGSANARSIVIRGSDIFIAGNELNANKKSMAKLWKKTGSTQGATWETEFITDGTQNAYAISVFVLDTTVYVAGYEENATLTAVAKLWKKAGSTQAATWETEFTTDGTQNAFANAIFALGTDVYIAGSQSNTNGIRVAKVWKKTASGYTPSSLSDGTVNEAATSVYVSGTDVFVVGNILVPGLSFDSTGRVWVNSVNKESAGDNKSYSKIIVEDPVISK